MALGLPRIYLAKNSFNYFAHLIPYLPLSHDAFSLLLFFARFLLDALCLSLPYTPPSPSDLPLLFL